MPLVVCFSRKLITLIINNSKSFVLNSLINTSKPSVLQKIVIECRVHQVEGNHHLDLEAKVASPEVHDASQEEKSSREGTQELSVAHATFVGQDPCTS